MGTTTETKEIAKTAERLKKERLHWLVEQGFNENAIAVFGTTTTVLKRILETGQILPNPAFGLEYQRQLTKSGKFLYYALPLLGRIEPVIPHLVQKIRARFPSDWSKEEIGQDFQPDYVKKVATHYAAMTAVEDKFHEETNINLPFDAVIGLASEVLPVKQFRDVKKDLDPIFDVDEDYSLEVHGEEIAHAKSSLERSRLVEVLETAFKKRGVLIYFNNEILNSKIYPGHEAEGEIMVVSDKPLPLNVISGVEILSEAERLDLEKHL